MKAILEFAYPEDEDRLRYAMNGERAIAGLDHVRVLIRNWEKRDGDNAEALVDLIKSSVALSLKECGEE